MNREQDLPCLGSMFKWSKGAVGWQFVAPVKAHTAQNQTACSMERLETAGQRVRNIFCRGPVLLSLVALLFATSSAKGACGFFPQKAPKAFSLLPVALSQDERFGDDPDRDHDRDHGGSILGLWHVKYVTSDGTPMFDSFKFWHPDGTEWESASVSPLDGNVCLGVWRETRRGTIRLHHVAWTFASGVLTGSITIDEVNTVAPNGRTYTGTHTNTFYDLNGNVTQIVEGTQTAKRITVNSTGAP